MAYMRIVTTINVYATVSIHLGVQHLTLADDWNYTFYKKVNTKSPFHPLKDPLFPLQLGVANTVDLANMVLANNNPYNYLCVMTNLTPNSILQLVKRNTVKPTLDIYQNLLQIPTPITNTLRLWSDVFLRYSHNIVDKIYINSEDFNIDDCVQEWLHEIDPTTKNSLDKLKSVIYIMYMNTVFHEIVSNPQLVKDTVHNKLVFSVRNDKSDGLPSAWVHLRTIGTSISTSGNSIRLVQHNISNLSTDTFLDECYDCLFNDIIDIAFTIEEDNDTQYTSLLHPDNIECSIAW